MQEMTCFVLRTTWNLLGSSNYNLGVRVLVHLLLDFVTAHSSLHVRSEEQNYIRVNARPSKEGGFFLG